MDKKKIARALLLIFVGVILFGLGWKFNIQRFSLDASKTVGIVLFIIAASELGDEVKFSKKFIIICSACVALLTIMSFVCSFLATFNADLSKFYGVSNDEEFLAVIRGFQETIKAIRVKNMISVILSSIVSIGICLAIVYGVVRFENEAYQAVGEKINEKLKHRAICYVSAFVAVTILSAIFSIVLVEEISKIDATSFRTVEDGLLRFSIAVLIPSLFLGVSGILVLVFGIMFIVELYRSYSFFKENVENKTVSNTDAINAEVNEINNEFDANQNDYKVDNDDDNHINTL